MSWFEMIPYHTWIETNDELVRHRAEESEFNSYHSMIESLTSRVRNIRNADYGLSDNPNMTVRILEATLQLTAVCAVI